MSFKVLGTGSYVPPRVVTNDELSTFWYFRRMDHTAGGMKTRHVCTTETRRTWLTRRR
jgi:3-oxoacyl-[acyl-carrier-protein] synthase III